MNQNLVERVIVCTLIAAFSFVIGYTLCGSACTPSLTQVQQSHSYDATPNDAAPSNDPGM